MQSLIQRPHAHGPAALDVRVEGADGAPVTPADLRRLFPGSMLTEARFDRLNSWPRTLVLCGERIVGLATCRKGETELRVADVGVDANCGCGEAEVVDVLLDALETAALAGGCRRIVLMAPKCVAVPLDARGYDPVSRPTIGWFEKRLV
jgi:hypothetical protein